MTRALLWSAVSSLPQAAKDSLAQQEADARAFCEARGWEIAGTLSVPGHTREYIQYDEAAAEMEAYRLLREHLERRDVDVLVCRSLDRLGRTPALIHQVAAYCQRSGVQLHCLNLPMTGNATADNFLFAIGGAMAGNELTELRRRFRDGMDGRAYRGLPIMSMLPFPYKREYVSPNGTERVTSVAVLDAAGAAALSEVGRMVTGGASYEAGARYLSALGFRTQKDGPWCGTSLAILLRNPFLTGQIVYHTRRGERKPDGRYRQVHVPPALWLTAKGRHEPVFTADEWAALQAVMVRRVRGRPTQGQGFWCGILRCGYCGGPMAIDYRPPYVGYRCSRRAWARCAYHNQVTEWRVTKQVLAHLQWLAREPEPDSRINPPPTIPDHSAELADIDRREKAAYLAYETGRITINLYDERVKELKALRETLQTHLLEAEEARAAWDSSQERRVALREAVPQLPAMMESLPRPEVNRLMRTLLREIVVKDNLVLCVR